MWKESIRVEIQRAREAERVGNEGRVRVSARRAAGIALEELARHLPSYATEGSMIDQLASIGNSDAVPESIRAAANRLAARVNKDFTSPSTNPIDDAMIVIEFVGQMLDSA